MVIQLLEAEDILKDIKSIVKKSIYLVQMVNEREVIMLI